MLRFSPPIKEKQPQETGVLKWISVLSGSGESKVVSGEGVDEIRMFSFFFFLWFGKQVDWFDSHSGGS